MKEPVIPARYDFFAFLARMQYISRWGLMRNTQAENIKEHSLDVAMLAHALVVIRNTFFGGELDPGRAALYAIFHDASEIFTGDMPTPVKHFNPRFKRSFHQLEDRARKKLLAMLPPELTSVYEPLFFFEEQDAQYKPLIKAADKIAALIKCLEEEKSGNLEFKRAGEEHLENLRKSPLPEVIYFLDHFLPGYRLSLDELHLG
ncbi:5'-deoxynucleotidase [Trichlorobacter ammonificans]|uniref:5'-deoxynucleotidase SO_2484 n=1 Tax=Trichlorobacter ammonificans TaxID=2916410 RepID=A0ABM9D6M5_9BACT|nr:5'-deoxynucleotidase [Trichlorobacter ammonificans]CAH2030840.1 5'-deoxynucleotidase SO_2484 [Trichlorobacter ammonificans]